MSSTVVWSGSTCFSSAQLIHFSNGGCISAFWPRSLGLVEKLSSCFWHTLWWVVFPDTFQAARVSLLSVSNGRGRNAYVFTFIHLRGNASSPWDPGSGFQLMNFFFRVFTQSANRSISTRLGPGSSLFVWKYEFAASNCCCVDNVCSGGRLAGSMSLGYAL